MRSSTFPRSENDFDRISGHLTVSDVTPSSSVPAVFASSRRTTSRSTRDVPPAIELEEGASEWRDDHQAGTAQVRLAAAPVLVIHERIECLLEEHAPPGPLFFEDLLVRVR